MKPMPWTAALMAGFALGLSACQQKQQPQAQLQPQPAPLPAYPAEPEPSLASLDTAPSGDPYATDPIVNPEAHRARKATDAPAARRYDTPNDIVVASATSTSGRVHTMRPGETLYGLARQYYGDGKKWRVIYEANQNRLTDIDDIHVGMKLIVP